MKKRFFALLTAFALSAALLAGCGGTDISGSTAAPTPTPQPINVYDYNPLTGQEKAADLPDGQRPVAIMVNNVQAALPQTGIAAADVIYEMETEAGITRMMAVYSDYTKVPLVGPVRSARDQFVQFVLPLNALFVHIGGSTYANEMLNYYQYQDIDGLYLGLTAFVFDEERYKTKAQEHCWYTSAELIAQGISAVSGLSTTGTLIPLFQFGSAGSGEADAKEISFRFSSYGDAAFHYDAASGRYLKDIYGAAQLDAGTGEQLSFDNLFVLFAKVGYKADTQLTDFDLSEGEGYYFTGGRYTPIHWEKEGHEAPLKVYDEDGGELTVNPGKSYIAVVSTAQAGTLSIDGALLLAEQPDAAAQG